MFSIVCYSVHDTNASSTVYTKLMVHLGSLRINGLLGVERPVAFCIGSPVVVGWLCAVREVAMEDGIGMDCAAEVVVGMFPVGSCRDAVGRGCGSLFSICSRMTTCVAGSAVEGTVD